MNFIKFVIIIPSDGYIEHLDTCRTREIIIIDKYPHVQCFNRPSISPGRTIMVSAIGFPQPGMTVF